MTDIPVSQFPEVFTLADTDVIPVITGMPGSPQEGKIAVANARDELGGGGGGGPVLLGSHVATTTESVLEVSSIPASHTGLLLVARMRSNRSGNDSDNVLLRLGTVGTTDTGSNYRYFRRREGSVAGNDESSSATSILWGFASAATSPAGMFGTGRIEIPDYSATHQRELLATSGQRAGSNFRLGTTVGHWTNTSGAIDIVRLIPENGTGFVAGSYLRVYGVE